MAHNIPFCVLSTRIGLMELAWCLAAVLAAGATGAYAESWTMPAPRDCYSGNGQYVFHIDPTFGKVRMEDFKYGACRGILSVKKGDTTKVLWERTLVNNIAPVSVYVSDTGKCVVTVGEWNDLSSMPFVFYGENGQLVNAYARVGQISDSLVAWRDWPTGGLFFFGPDADTFIVRFRTGQMILFETATGQLLDERWRQDYYSWKLRQQLGLFKGTPDMRAYERVKDRLKELVLLEALQSAASEKPETAGTSVLAAYTDAESTHILREALRNGTSRIVHAGGKTFRVYPIRAAAKTALESRGVDVPHDVVTQEDLK